MIEYSLVTPLEITDEGKASSVVISSAEGQMEIFPNHAPIIFIIHPGYIYIKKNDKVTKFLLKSGYASFADDKLVLMVEEYYDLENLSQGEKDELISKSKKHIEELRSSNSIEDMNIAKEETFISYLS